MQSKRTRSLMVIPFSGVLLLTACSGAKTASDSEASPLGGSPAVSVVLYGMDMPFPEGMDENRNPYLDYIEQGAGLDVGILLPPEDAYEEKLNVIMASGNLPDLINATNGIWVDEYARQGELLPLDDLLQRYGKHLLANIPEELWDRVRFDGHIYAIPSLSETKGTELMYARKDWLDRLGLEPPRTLEQYYEVIKAFAKDDPDGNGIDDTYGFILTENLGRSSPFFGAFGTQLNQWIERDGQLVYGNVLAETKEALEFLARLYREGLMDPLYPLNETATLADKIIAGKVGLYSATWYDTRGAIKTSMDRDPEAEWIALDYPIGPDGRQGVYGNNPIRSYNVVPKGSANPVGAIRMLDFIAGQGYETLKLGFENDVWTRENGVMSTDFSKHNEQQYRGIYQSLADFDNPTLNAQRLDSLGPFHLNANLKAIESHLVPDAFMGAPTPAMSLFNAKLKELQDVFDNLVMGLEPMEAFDDYVAQWYANGGAEMTREVNAWYRQSKQGMEK